MLPDERKRPERSKALSPGQGEQREPAPWVCCIPAICALKGQKHFYLLRVGIITASPPCCKAFALSGRWYMKTQHTQGVAPLRSLALG